MSTEGNEQQPELPADKPENTREDHVIDRLLRGDDDFAQTLGAREIPGQKGRILSRAARRKEGKDPLNVDLDPDTKDPHKAIRKNLKEIKAHMLDQDEPFLTNIEKGSTAKLFYDMLAMEYPVFAVTLREAKDKEGTVIPDTLAVMTDPKWSNKELLYRVSNDNPVLELFKSAGEIFIGRADEARKLEEEWRIPEGYTDRMIARIYAGWIKEFEEGKEHALAEEFKKRAAQIGVEPLEDRDLQMMFRKELESEMDKAGIKGKKGVD